MLAGMPKAEVGGRDMPVLEPARARCLLVRGLQLAHAGEWGAVHAYLGHRASLPHGADREMILEILRDEVRHRRVLVRMMASFGVGPDPAHERKLLRIGRAIGRFCLVGGWYLPMYGAARLEADNIVEYENLARLAWFADRHDLIDDLLELAEVEWDHEALLRGRAASHPLWRLSPRWPVPPPRASIRGRFEAFLADPRPPVLQKRALR